MVWGFSSSIIKWRLIVVIFVILVLDCIVGGIILFRRIFRWFGLFMVL